MIGRTVSHYTIIEKLGEGGMGVVYKAEDSRLKRHVALKFLPQGFSESGEELARFQQEAEAISALNHPNIATIFDIGEDQERKFLVLEFIGGGTLKQRIRSQAEGAGLSNRELLELGAQIASGLGHAHKNQIVHRDIKSDNIMLTAEGVVKITDFGLAKLRGSAQLTRAGSTIGTLAYMSPEQLHGEEIDHRADIFSAGAVLYEMATGQLPFRGEHEAAVMYQIANEDPELPGMLKAGLPQGFDAIVMKALQKDRGKRYQNAETLASDLRALQTGSVGTLSATLQAQQPEPISAVQSLAGKNGGGRKAMILLGIVAALALTGLIWFALRNPEKPAQQVTAPQRSKSIAVLPFANLSDDKQNEYFADGVTQELIAELSKIADLKVISRTSAMQYKNTTKSAKEIGRELGVGTILEGSIQRSGNRLRVVADLIDAENEGHLWGNTFDREMKDLFAVQDDITGHIVSALTLTLNGEEQRALTSSRTANLKAHDLYLQGMFYYNQLTEPSLRQSLDLLGQAIKEDSNYADAYAGMAFVYEALADAYAPPHETYPKAKAAALNAIALDSANGLAECALGVVLNQYEWKLDEADIHMRKALRLEPNSFDVNVFFGLMTMVRGNTAEALSAVDHAINLDPRAPLGYWMKEWILYWANRFDDVLEAHKQTALLDPHFFYWDDLCAAALREKGMLKESLEEYQIQQKLVPGHNLFGMAITYARMGNKQEALKVITAVVAESKRRYIAADQIAAAYAGLGDLDNAFKYLEKAYNDHSAGVVIQAMYPDLAPMRKDPRFGELQRKYRK